MVQRSSTPAAIGLAAFAIAVLLSLWLHHASALHDTDSYFHLAIARIYAEEGIAQDLPALRMSLLRDGYGDKEFLFHLALAPLLKFLPPLAAGRLALALAAGAIAALLAMLASRVIGGWALLFPFWLAFASTEFTWRLVRLRPELLSLVLLLLAAWAMAGRRDLLLGLLVAVYTLGYTAFHALLGLIFLAFVAFGLREAGADWRRWPWRMLLYSWIGAGVGLVAHPHFPKNLAVWWVQNFVFFREKAGLDVGTEIRPNTTDVLLMVHLGLFAVVLVLVWAARRVPSAAAPPEPTAEQGNRLAIVFAIYAGAFGLLYALMSRFSIYFWPFAALAFLFALEQAGFTIGSRLPLGRSGRRLPLAAGLAFGLLLSAPEAWRQLHNYRERTALGPDAARLDDRERLSAALPAGAKVAADWGPTATYLLWAPQALFLNALDPNFMAFQYPQQHAALRAILDGEEPDVPGKAVQVLDSDFLAFPAAGHQELIDRLDDDPRAVLRHRGSHRLYEFRPAPELVTDWKLAPGDAILPIGTEVEIASWPAYPLVADPRGRAIEGYVDGNRVAPEIQCLNFVRDIVATTAETRRISWSAAGEATFWLDGEERLRSRGRSEFALELAPGRHRLGIRICALENEGYKGFFWRETR